MLVLEVAVNKVNQQWVVEKRRVDGVANETKAIMNSRESFFTQVFTQSVTHSRSCLIMTVSSLLQRHSFFEHKIRTERIRKEQETLHCKSSLSLAFGSNACLSPIQSLVPSSLWYNMFSFDSCLVLSFWISSTFSVIPYKRIAIPFPGFREWMSDT